MAPEPTRSEANAVLLANLGNPVYTQTTREYNIYGMKISSTSISMQIETAWDYVEELLGTAAMIEPTNYNKIKLFVADYATLRVLGTLQGTAITTHFNYSSSGLNVQKPLIGSMSAMVEHYTKQCSLWRKMLLTRSHVSTGTYAVPADLELSIPNRKDEDSDIKIISFDSTSV